MFTIIYISLLVIAAYAAYCATNRSLIAALAILGVGVAALIGV